MEPRHRFKIGVDKPVLLLLSGLMWVAVGCLLLGHAYSWLSVVPQSQRAALLAGVGVFAALIIHHFGFLRVVDKNLGRILPMDGKRCVFSFMSWKSYLIVVVMVAMGLGLRHSPIPKPLLAPLYVGIGLALLLSSVRYLRVFVRQVAGKS